MKRHILFSLFSLVVVVFCSCNKIDTSDILCNASKTVAQYPDSALALLKMIPSPHYLNNAELAQYGWIKGLAHYKKKYSLIDDSLVAVSLKYYQSQQDTSKMLLLYDLASTFYFANNDYENGYKILEEAIETSKKLKDSTQISYFHLLKGVSLLHQKRAKEAEVNLKNSFLFKETPEPYYILGLRLAGKDSIGYYLDKCIDLALKSKDSTSASHYLRNYGQILYGWGNYNISIQKLHQAMSLSVNNFSPALVLSQNYLQLGKLDSAQYYLDIAKKNRLTQTNQQTVLTRENSIAQVQSVIDYILYNKYNDTQIAQYNDSLYFAIQSQQDLLIARMETRHNLEKENMQLVINSQQSQLWGIIITSFMLILIGVALLYVQNRRKKLQKAEESIETLSHLLKEATDSAVNESDNRFFKKILLQQLGLIRLVAAVPTSANQELLKQMANISNNNIPTDSLLAWDDLFPIIDSIYDNFYTKMVGKYGNVLNEKEIELCCLLCADFRTKEINVVTQQSVHTVYRRKTTIRSKLKIEENKDIIAFLEQQFLN